MIELEAQDDPVVDRALDLPELLDEADRRELLRRPGRVAGRGQEVAEQPDRLGLGGDRRGLLELRDRRGRVSVERVDPAESDEGTEIGRADGERRLVAGLAVAASPAVRAYSPTA